MTIAAGFVCTDGLLLASDTLFTGVTKRFGRKLWANPFGSDGVVSVGGSATEAALLRIKDEIFTDVRPDLTEADILREADQIVQYVITAESSAGILDKPEILLGITTEGRSALYFSVNGGVFARLPPEAPVRCVGWATGLGQYVADRLCPPEGLPIKWAKVVGAYLVKQAVTYSGYCGGDTNLLEITNVGATKFIDDHDEIARLEAYLAEINDAVRVVLPDGRANDETLEHRLQTLNESIRRVRDSFVITTAPAYFRRTVTTTAPVSGSLETKATAPQSPQDSTRDPKSEPPSPESPGGSDES